MVPIASMRRSEYEAFWHGTTLIRWNHAFLLELGVPDEVLTALSEWGLPTGIRAGWLGLAAGHNQDRSDHFGRNLDYCLRLASPRRDGERYRVFCFAYTVPICFDTESNWAVVTMDSGDYDPSPTFKWNNPEAYPPTLRFVNSGPLSFLRSLTAYERYVRLPLGEDDLAAAQQEIVRLEDTLRETDPVAFSDRESFWPLICWDVREDFGLNDSSES